jgi:hypothetical protein
MKFANILIPLTILICLNSIFAGFLIAKNDATKKQAEFDDNGVIVYAIDDNDHIKPINKYHYKPPGTCFKSDGLTSKPIQSVVMDSNEDRTEGYQITIVYKSNSKSPIKKKVNQEIYPNIPTWDMAIAQLKIKTRLSTLYNENHGLGVTALYNYLKLYKFDREFQAWNFNGGRIDDLHHEFSLGMKGLSVVALNDNDSIQRLIPIYGDNCIGDGKQKPICKFTLDDIKNVKITKMPAVNEQDGVVIHSVKFIFNGDDERRAYIVDEITELPFIQYVEMLFENKILDEQTE